MFKNILCFPLLVLKGIDHYWTFFSRGGKANGRLMVATHVTGWEREAFPEAVARHAPTTGGEERGGACSAWLSLMCSPLKDQNRDMRAMNKRPADTAWGGDGIEKVSLALGGGFKNRFVCFRPAAAPSERSGAQDRVPLRLSRLRALSLLWPQSNQIKEGRHGLLPTAKLVLQCLISMV